MKDFCRAPRVLLACALIVLPALAVPVASSAAPPTKDTFFSVVRDDRLCRFPIEVTVSGTTSDHFLQTQGQAFREIITGPSRVDLQNLVSGRKIRLQSPSVLDLRETSGSFRGLVIGLYSGIPLIVMRGETTFSYTDFTIVSDPGPEAVLDPCALLDPQAQPVVPRTIPPPWDQPQDVLGAMILAGVVPVFFGLERHVHAHLDVFVDGDPVPVPAGIGLVEPVPRPDGGVESALDGAAPLHTHTSDGIVHVEADRTSPDLTLGRFFDLWQVRLTADCLGSLCSNGDSTLRVYVNGELAVGDPRTIPFGDHDEVAVVFGLPGVPATMPSSYDFPDFGS